MLDVVRHLVLDRGAVSQKNPGRRYVGVCASGVRLTAAEIRVAEVLMAGAQLLLDRDPASADPT